MAYAADSSWQMLSLNGQWRRAMTKLPATAPMAIPMFTCRLRCVPDGAKTRRTSVRGTVRSDPATVIVSDASSVPRSVPRIEARSGSVIRIADPTGTRLLIRAHAASPRDAWMSGRRVPPPSSISAAACATARAMGPDCASSPMVATIRTVAPVNTVLAIRASSVWNAPNRGKTGQRAGSSSTPSP
jgi:hypothetical protein